MLIVWGKILLLVGVRTWSDGLDACYQRATLRMTRSSPMMICQQWTVRTTRQWMRRQSVWGGKTLTRISLRPAFRHMASSHVRSSDEFGSPFDSCPCPTYSVITWNPYESATLSPWRHAHKDTALLLHIIVWLFGLEWPSPSTIDHPW